MKKIVMVAVMVLLLVAGLSRAADYVYQFDNATVDTGIDGNDGWVKEVSSSDSVMVRDDITGALSGQKVVKSEDGTWVDWQLGRVNDANFSYSLDAKKMVLVSYVTKVSNANYQYVGLACDTNSTASDGYEVLGPVFGVEKGEFKIRQVLEGPKYGDSISPLPNGTQIRHTMLIAPAGFAGNGAGRAYYQTWDSGSSAWSDYTQIGGLLNKPLGLNSLPADCQSLDSWNALYARVAYPGSYVGDIEFTTIEHTNDVYSFGDCANVGVSSAGGNADEKLVGQGGWIQNGANNNIYLVNDIGGGLSGQNIAYARGTDTTVSRLSDMHYTVRSLDTKHIIILSAVMRVKGGSYYSYFGLGADSNADGKPDKLATQFGFEYSNWAVRDAANTSTKTAHGISADTQVKVTLTINPVVNSGDGSGSLSYQTWDGSGWSAATKPSALQDINLHLSSLGDYADPSTWDTFYLRLHNSGSYAGELTVKERPVGTVIMVR